MVERWSSADERLKAFLTETHDNADDPGQVYVVSAEEFDGETPTFRLLGSFSNREDAAQALTELGFSYVGLTSPRPD